jgi:hypothetical protein
LQAHFDDGQLVEITSVIGLFNFFNRYADALQIQPPPTSGSGAGTGTGTEPKA